MKGYFSWVLVFGCVLVLISLIHLIQVSESKDQSKSVILVRAELSDLNFKDVTLELLRQGIVDAYGSYDLNHNRQVCSHCLDYGCFTPSLEEIGILSAHYLENPPVEPPKKPLSPSYLGLACYEPVCPVCFRLDDAKRISKIEGLSFFHRLDGFNWSSDFEIIFEKEPDISIIVKPNPLEKNGYELVGFRFNSDFNYEIVSRKFNFSAKSKIPRNYEHSTLRVR